MSTTAPIYYYPRPVGSHPDALATVEYGEEGHRKRYAVTLMAGGKAVSLDNATQAKVATLIGKLLRAHELRHSLVKATLQTMDDTGLQLANGVKQTHDFMIYKSRNHGSSTSKERRTLAADLASKSSTGKSYNKKKDYS